MVLLAACLAVLVLPAAALATMRYVSVVGNDTTGDGTLVLPFATVQKGLNVAHAGDIVSVGPGTFRGDSQMTTAGVSLRGAGAGLTTLRGTGTKSAISVAGLGGDSAISGFTITGGGGPGGGGIAITSASTLAVRDNLIIGNVTSAFAGGIAIYSSSPTIAGNTIAANVGGNFGGGIFCYNGTPLITGNSISGNTANDGGGVYCTGASPAITGNSVIGNTATGTGGGFYVTSVSSPSVTKNVIAGNRAVSGGGIYSEGSSATIAMDSIVGNSASAGGGIYGSSGSLAVWNDVIAGNTASGSGGGITVGTAAMSMTNDTVVGNNAASSGGPIDIQAAFPTFTNCIVWGNSDDLPGVYATYSNLSGGGGGGLGNISVDPDFVAAEAGNYHLSAGSKCIDSATSTVAPQTDRDGIARPWGGGYDMGAYEYFDPTPNTTTSLSAPSSVKVNKSLKLSGVVSPWSPPGKVTITKTRLVGKKWKSAGSAKVSVVSGEFTYSFKPTIKGKWRFVATYSGGVLGPSRYLSSKSGVKSVTVN